MRRFIRTFFIALALIVIATLAIDRWVTQSTRAQLFSDTAGMRASKVGLLLGTAKYVRGGGVNLYYRYRIEAAEMLYKSGKISFILISGDNSKEHYNEPETMKADLVARGIPAEKIFLDYAGFRTLDSIVRCKDIFGERRITIISQPFHNQRAVFLANRKGVQAIAYNAQDVPQQYGVKVLLREKLARVKMVLDLVFNKQPKFGGERIAIQ